jgi:hypothetical protein
VGHTFKKKCGPSITLRYRAMAALFTFEMAFREKLLVALLVKNFPISLYFSLLFPQEQSLTVP